MGDPSETTKANPVPPIIAELVARFDEHRETYRHGDYNETQLRRDFLDPMFEALGWDIDNRQGYAEAYRDVIHEDALRVEKTVKAPDYCFRIGGTRKFFVEAKRPSVDIKQLAGPAFQLRRYAWTAKLPLSILTDFEEFAVYDCRIKPDKDDQASTARVMYLQYTDYLKRWDDIAGIFTPEAIRRGSFDKYAESNKKKRGTAEVDQAFLEEIEAWRESLAKNLSVRNADLSDRDLNYSVQTTIDRIIFLRMCEGRGIEPYGRLQSLMNGPQVYGRLVEIFQRADEKYNSGLFHFHEEKDREPPDELTTKLTIDDRVLKEIIGRLYYPESPYEFAALPADILGHVYEQFLGKVIRLTAGHHAKIEEKPEVRKAGGVYYTPTYIVDYIVNNTVGKLLEGRSAQEVGGLTDAWKPSKTRRPLAVLDPACGSGSFLIVAYQYLLNWYLKQYTEHDKPEVHARGADPRIYHTDRGDWRLTTEERKRILLSHIYGVDIDYQAVEVTKLSLLLKVLEGETEESLERQSKLFHKHRALPDLANNIKCGNSLIGPDCYQNQQMSLLDEDERLRINVFDWSGKDGFPQIMQSGGFDAIIGNPPWLMAGYYVKESIAYLRSHYQSCQGKFDLYYAFVEQSCRLLAPSGTFGMIVPNKFFHTSAARGLRLLLSKGRWISQIVDFGDSKLFQGATNYSSIVLLNKTGHQNIQYVRATTGLEIVSLLNFNSSNLADAPWHFEDESNANLFKKLETNSARLESLVSRFGSGVQSGADRILIFKQGSTHSIEPTVLRPIVKGRDVRRYRLSTRLDQLLFPYAETKREFVPLAEAQIKCFPNAYDHLVNSRKALEKRIWFGKGAAELSGSWYGLMYLDSPSAFHAAHILTPALSNRSNFAIGNGDLFATGTAGVTSIIPRTDLPEAIRYLLGVLNSSLLSYYATHHSPVFSGGYFKFSAPYLKTLPIRRINFKEKTDKHRHDRVVELVQQMLDLQRRLAETKTEHDRSAIQRQIDATDRQIDQLVYELYDLTPDEIRLVENATT